jgi:hypothetical protein
MSTKLAIPPPLLICQKPNRHKDFSLASLTLACRRVAKVLTSAPLIETYLLLEILPCKTLAQKSVLLRGLLRQSGALQKLLGHLNLSITQIYAETSLRALGDNYIRALGGMR